MLEGLSTGQLNVIIAVLWCILCALVFKLFRDGIDDLLYEEE